MTALRNITTIAQGFERWRPFEGQEYLVFIDESFFKFFDFAHKDGNFVHGAMGLPVSRYDDFQRMFTPAVEEYKASFFQSKQLQANELKSAEIYKLEFGVRHRLILKMRAALEENGGFIAGFYTSNRGYIMEKIREDLIDIEGIQAVPEDHAQLYDEMINRLKETAQGPGMSDLISRMLSLPVMAMSFFFSSLNCSFRVVYDPRQEEEDVAVKNQVEGIMAALHNAEKLGLKSKFLGLEIDRPSHQEIGLQVADIVAGEVRRFFRFNPELLLAGSDLNLITFGHQEGETPLIKMIDGKLIKTGRQVAIPRALHERAMEPTEDCLFAYLPTLLAAGLVTCITEFGTERDVSLFSGQFLDLCD